MSEKAPLALQWLCFIRDHGQDFKVTLGERALASLLVTYGQGKNIYVAMKSLARITGWSRTTVIKHRDGLLAKGLLEDITGNPDKQDRTYRLTMPGYVSQGVQNLDTGVQHLDGGVQILDTGCSESEHNIKTEIKREINPSHQPTRSAEEATGEAPEGKVSPWQVVTFWQARSGDWRVFCHGEIVPDRAPRSARTVTLVSADETRYFHDDLRRYATFGEQAAFLALSPAERQERCQGYASAADGHEAQAEDVIIAGEIESYRDKLISETGLRPGNVDYWIEGWREKSLTDVQVRDRLRFNLDKRLARVAG